MEDGSFMVGKGGQRDDIVRKAGAGRTLSQLIALGMVKARQAPEDQRRKIITLTPNGQRLIDAAKQNVWPRIEDAVSDLCGRMSGPLLEQLAAIEDGLAARPLESRDGPAGKARR